MRVVPARARDQRAAQEAGHVHADLLDLLPQVFIGRVDCRGGLVRSQGLGPPAEVRESVPFHLQGRGVVRSDAEQILDGLETFPPAAVRHLEPGDRAE